MLQLLAGLALIAGCVWCFTSQEVEMFKLQAELHRKYGSDMNFYKFLKLSNGKQATSKQILKNLKQLSRKYHPDKNPKYHKLYERLSAATQILSNDERRKTYDYYLKNGFPDYDFSKGGYFFSRVQPKTYVILAFVYIAMGVIHYVILRIQHTANVRRINDFIELCKEADTTNGLGEKRISFQQHPEDEPKELLVKYGDVFLIERDDATGEETQSIVSASTITPPTVFDSMFFRLPVGLFNKITGRNKTEQPSPASKKKNQKNKRTKRN